MPLSRRNKVEERPEPVLSPHEHPAEVEELELPPVEDEEDKDDA